jgi:hypothetical protein
LRYRIALERSRSSRASGFELGVEPDATKAKSSTTKPKPGTTKSKPGTTKSKCLFLPPSEAFQLVTANSGGHLGVTTFAAALRSSSETSASGRSMRFPRINLKLPFGQENVGFPEWRRRSRVDSETTANPMPGSEGEQDKGNHGGHDRAGEDRTPRQPRTFFERRARELR